MALDSSSRRIVVCYDGSPAQIDLVRLASGG